MTDETSTLSVPEARLLNDIDDAVCQYENETLEARGVMAFIRELDHESGGTLGSFLTDDNEPMFRAVSSDWRNPSKVRPPRCATG